MSVFLKVGFLGLAILFASSGYGSRQYKEARKVRPIKVRPIKVRPNLPQALPSQSPLPPCVMELVAKSEFYVSNSSDMSAISEAQFSNMTKTLLRVNEMLAEGQPTLYSKRLQRISSEIINGEFTLIPGRVYLVAVPMASVAVFQPAMRFIVAPYFYNFDDGQGSFTQSQYEEMASAGVAALVHEYGHNLIYINLAGMPPGKNWEALSLGYQEFYSDLLVVLYEGPQSLNRLFPRGRKQRNPELFRDLENASRGRDFMAEIPVETWIEDESHILLGPSRSYFGKHYLRPEFTAGRRGLIANRVQLAIREELAEGGNELANLTPAEINRRFILRLKKKL